MSRRRKARADNRAPAGVTTNAPASVETLETHHVLETHHNVETLDTLETLDNLERVEPATPQPVVIHPDIHGGSEEERAAVKMRATPLAPPRPLLITTRPDTVVPERAPNDGAPAGQSPPPPELAAAEPKRASSLDALRGLFLISMTLGFAMPTEYLPDWMYHRQFPPPGETVVDIAGISWRDLAYASFLFTMAAALPLTLSRRIDKGETEVEIIFAALKRYAILLFFAILIAHSNTFFLGYTQTARALAVVGFVIMAMIFTRRRKDWDPDRFRMIKRAGWVLAVAFLALSPLTYGKTFSFERLDDIIAGLAFASFAGSMLWYFTRHNMAPRFIALAIAVALFLGAKSPGWVQEWWYNSPVAWAFVPSRLILLTVVIPGTIAGDVILRWMRAYRTAEPTEAGDGWSGTRIALVATLCAVITPVVVVGLYNRQVQLTTQIVVVLLLVGTYLTWSPVTATDKMLRSLFLWGSLWLTIGLLLEPFEGGIKKVPDTLTYFFTVTGTTSLLLVTLTAVVDGLRRPRWLATLVDVGHNPLLCYVLYTVFLNSLFELIPPMRGVLRGSAAAGLTRALLSTLLVVLIVRALSRRRIYWRT